MARTTTDEGPEKTKLCYRFDKCGQTIPDIDSKKLCDDCREHIRKLGERENR